jgi:hypothetical protein
MNAPSTSGFHGKAYADAQLTGHSTVLSSYDIYSPYNNTVSNDTGIQWTSNLTASVTLTTSNGVTTGTFSKSMGTVNLDLIATAPAESYREVYVDSGGHLYLKLVSVS